MKAIFAVVMLFAPIVLVAQRNLGTRATESGGPLMPEQAAYDVTFYSLDLTVNPADSSIAGSVTTYATIVHPIEWFVLDLDTVFTVTATTGGSPSADIDLLEFERRGSRIWISLSQTYQPGERVRVRVNYHGRPRIAARPPWVGGFTWARTPSGQPWISLSCQNDGADLWWPCKDHPGDRADSVALRITVPAGLVCASNGKLLNVTDNRNGTSTFRWFVSTPINNYCVNISIAPYRTVDTLYTSVTGEKFPVTFWVIPEDYHRGVKHMPLFLKDLRFLEERLGPYPFRADKYGVVHTPYLGMEHQTLIAYGNEFRLNEFGYDWLHFHELAHEWWANLVSNADWKDMWIHEGFATYMEALYREHLAGDTAYHSFMKGIHGRISNRKPVAPRTATSSTEIYFFPPDYTRSDGDMYFKGAWILHTLRYLIGPQTMNRFLRRMAYPDPSLERVTDGSHCRYATTADVLRTAELLSGTQLDWFFDVYLHQPYLPKLQTEMKGNELILRWIVPDNLPFPMPVEVQFGEARVGVDMKDGVGRVLLPSGVTAIVDPDDWILKAKE
jgi:aminopeptidase N